MKINLTNIIQHHFITKSCSIILGYSIWFCIAQHQIISQSFDAPVCFYDTDTEYITSPNFIKITVQGNRQELYKFKKEHAAIHLDGSKLENGHQEIFVGRENLFLPDTLKLIDLIPTHISIHVDTNEKL